MLDAGLVCTGVRSLAAAAKDDPAADDAFAYEQELSGTDSPIGIVEPPARAHLPGKSRPSRLLERRANGRPPSAPTPLRQAYDQGRIPLAHSSEDSPHIVRSPPAGKYFLCERSSYSCSTTSCSATPAWSDGQSPPGVFVERAAPNSAMFFASITISRAWHAARWQLPDLASGERGHLARCPQHPPGPGTIQAQGAPDSLSRGMSSDVAGSSGGRERPAWLPQECPGCRFPLRVRPISYIMLTMKSGWIYLPAWARASPLSYFLSAIFPSFCCASS